MGPDEELLGVVVHSGLVLGRSDDVAAAIRRITAFPSGLALDTVVLAARSTPKPPADESMRQRPNDGPRKQPSSWTRPRPSTTAGPKRSETALPRPTATTR